MFSVCLILCILYLPFNSWGPPLHWYGMAFNEVPQFSLKEISCTRAHMISNSVDPSSASTTGFITFECSPKISTSLYLHFLLNLFAKAPLVSFKRYVVHLFLEVVSIPSGDLEGPSVTYIPHPFHVDFISLLPATPPPAFCIQLHVDVWFLVSLRGTTEKQHYETFWVSYCGIPRCPCVKCCLFSSLTFLR